MIDRYRSDCIQPAIHFDWYWDNTKDHPGLYSFFPFGPFDSTEKTFRAWFAQRIQQNQDAIIYAAYDKVLEPNPTPAGIIGFLNASPMNLCVEVGFIFAFPRYQRTHLTTNMIGLLLQYCLELPENGGLGLRRVQWQANAQNETSIKAAIRMGFHYEGVKRWDRVIVASAGKQNTAERLPREGDPRRRDFGRHTAILGLCWDDWEDGIRDKVRELMKPR